MLASPKTQVSTQYDFLIIGYGSELRGDDAVGPRVAMAVAEWQLPSVKSLAVHQLTPELTVDMAQAHYVIFVDACGRSCAQTIQIDPIGVSKSTSDVIPAGTHSNTPSVLLSLTQQLYGHHPQGWLLQVSTECFDLGSQLSSTACQGCDRALRTIEQFFKTYRRPFLMGQASCMKSA
ncbi:MAG: hydrogenase maturation protease [Cyanobacteria bacterium J06635_15]